MERSRSLPPSDVTEELDNVLRLRLTAREPESIEQRNRHRRLGRDCAADLEAVQRAAEALSANERRAKEIEARGVALAERALQQLKHAEARIQAADDAVRAAEARALEAEARMNEAETRAQEAEHWLARLHDAIQDRLVARRDASNGYTAAA